MVDSFGDGQEDEHAWANFNTIRREIPAHLIYDIVNSNSEECAAPSLLLQFYPVKDQTKFKARIRTWLNKILAGIGHCAATGELYPGLYAWNEKLMSFLQEFGFYMPKDYVKKLLIMYLRILIKYPSCNRTSVENNQKSSQNSSSPNPKKFKKSTSNDPEIKTPKFSDPDIPKHSDILITVKNDFRALIVISGTLSALLQIPKFALSSVDFQLPRDLAFGIFKLIKYLKFDSQLRKLLDTEYNNSLHVKAGSKVADVARKFAKFIKTEDINEFLIENTVYAVQAGAKHIFMPNYEECIWYMELILSVNESVDKPVNHEFFHNEIFPLLWKKYPEFKILDDRTIYLLNNYLYVQLPKLSEETCSNMLDTILSSLIVRLKLPIGSSRLVAFENSAITSSEIRNYTSYASVIAVLCAHLPMNLGMNKLCDFFKSTQNFFYISNAEVTRQKSVATLFSLLKELSIMFHDLKRMELYPRKTELNDHKMPVLSNQKIQIFIDVVLHLVDYSIFSSYNSHINECLHQLAILDPARVCPFVWKKVFHHLNTYTSSSESSSIIQPILKTSYWTILPSLYWKVDEVQLAELIKSCSINIDPRNEIEKTNISILLLKTVYSMIGPISEEKTPILAEATLDFFCSFLMVLEDYELAAANVGQNSKDSSSAPLVSEDDGLLYSSLLESFMKSLSINLQIKVIKKIKHYLLTKTSESTACFLLPPIGSLPNASKLSLLTFTSDLLKHAHDLVEPVFQSPPDATTSVSKTARYGFRLLMILSEHMRWQCDENLCEAFLTLIEQFCTDKMAENMTIRTLAFEAIETIISSFYIQYEAFIKNPENYDEKRTADLEKITDEVDNFPHAFYEKEENFVDSIDLRLKLYAFRSYSIHYEKVDLPRREFIQACYDRVFKNIELKLKTWAESKGATLEKNSLKYTIEVYCSFAKTFMTYGGYGPIKTEELYSQNTTRTEFRSNVEFPLIHFEDSIVENSPINEIQINPIGDCPRTYFTEMLAPVMQKFCTDYDSYPDLVRKDCIEAVFFSVYNSMIEELGYLPINPDEITNSRQSSMVMMNEKSLFTNQGVFSLLKLFCMSAKSSNRVDTMLLAYDNVYVPTLETDKNTWLRILFETILSVSKEDKNRSIRMMAIGYLNLLADSYGRFMYDDIAELVIDTCRTAVTEDEMECACQIASELLPGLLATKPFKILIEFLPVFFALPHHDRRVGAWQDVFSNACVEPLQTIACFTQATNLDDSEELMKIAKTFTDLCPEVVTNNGIARIEKIEYYQMIQTVCKLLVEGMDGESYKIQCGFDFLMVLIRWSHIMVLPQEILEAIFAVTCEYAIYDDQTITALAHDLLGHLCWVARDREVPKKYVDLNDNSNLETVLNNIQFRSVENENEHSAVWYVDDKEQRGLLLARKFGVEPSKTCKLPNLKVYQYPIGHVWPRTTFQQKHGKIFAMLKTVILNEEFIENYFLAYAEQKSVENDARFVFKRLASFLGGDLILPIVPVIVNLGKQSLEKKNYNILAAALLVGISQGSRHWSYKDQVQFDELISTYFLQRVEEKDVDIYKEWTNSFSNRDPRRFQYVYKTVFELLKSEPADWINKADEAVLYSKLAFLHQIVVVGKYRVNDICQILVDKIYKKQEVAYRFISHSNQKIRTIIVTILNNIVFGTFAKIITPNDMQNTFIYCLDKVELEEDPEKQRIVLKTILRCLQNYYTSPVYKEGLSENWLMSDLFPYIMKNSYLLQFTPPDKDLNKDCLCILRKLCTRTESDKSRILVILEKIFFRYSDFREVLSENCSMDDKTNEIKTTTQIHFSQKAPSINVLIGVMSFLPIYCWANVFTIKANKDISEKLLEFIIDFLVYNKSPEVRKSAAEALCSLTTATVFSIEPIIKRLKMLQQGNSIAFQLNESRINGSSEEFMVESQENSESQETMESQKVFKSNGDFQKNVNDDCTMNTSFMSTGNSMSTSRPTSPHSRQMKQLTNELHGIVLGFCAVIQSVPYSVPDWLPDLILFLNPLAHHKHVPIKISIRKAISEFRKTHALSWETLYKQKFNEEQLDALNDMGTLYTYFS